MTKPNGKEIVEQVLPYIDEKVKASDLSRIYTCIDSAIEKYAKQEAVAYGEWISNHKLDFQTSTGGNWIGLDMKRITNEQLFQLYLQSKAND